jgi:hypothetical protein
MEKMFIKSKFYSQKHVLIMKGVMCRKQLTIRDLNN